MLSEENLLKLKIRQEIYNLILEYPGLHLREISRIIYFSFDSLRHHLKFLEKYNLIVSRIDRRYIRYYVKQKVGKKDKEIFNVLRQVIPRKILLLMLCVGPGSIYKNSHKDTLGPYSKNPDPSIYSRIYSKKEIVELTKYWRKSAFKLFHLHKHQTTINFHLNKLIEADLIEEIKVGLEIKYR